MLAFATANPHEHLSDPLPVGALECHFPGLRPTGTAAPVLLAGRAVLWPEQLDAGAPAVL
jgi:hypothetical protein